MVPCIKSGGQPSSSHPPFIIFFSSFPLAVSRLTQSLGSLFLQPVYDDRGRHVAQTVHGCGTHIKESVEAAYHNYNLQRNSHCCRYNHKIHQAAARNTGTSGGNQSCYKNRIKNLSWREGNSHGLCACARSTFLAKILNIFGKIFWENRSLK